MKKSFKLFVFLTVPGLALLLPNPALAVCPVCTAAVIAGLGLSRWLGVDDTVSGIWIGGVLLSSSLWLASWLKTKFPSKPLISNPLLIIAATYLLVFIPLALTDIVGHPFNRLWGIDKLVLGTFFGSVAFWFGTLLDKRVRKIKGKQLFNYQKIIFPVVLLLLSSLVLWLLTKP